MHCGGELEILNIRRDWQVIYNSGALSLIRTRTVGLWCRNPTVIYLRRRITGLVLHTNTIVIIFQGQGKGF